MIKRAIIAPHCDDEVLGCGGLLAKYPEDSGVIVLAEPDDVREKEFHEARYQLGYQHFQFLHREDGYVGADMHDLVAQLDDALAEWKPLELYLPFPSMHQDHIAAYESGIRSARLSMRGDHWFPPRILVYDVAVYDIVMYPTELRWNVFEALTEEQIERKCDALAAYSSQQPPIGSLDHPCKRVRVMAQSIGAPRLLPFAEQFAAVREVRP
jgi:LmbE family N-acetylglucosaminyl deacetylase